MKIGFIGQGWIGKNYADNFERRGYKIVRFSLESAYKKNLKAINKCDITFVAVPTPTILKKFDSSIVFKVMKYIGKEKIVVIKSTLLPGTTEKLQNDNPDIYVFHSPEFLKEETAAHDVSYPTRNIIGMPINNIKCRRRAKKILSILPKSKYNVICNSREAELIKYAGNCFLFNKVVFTNIIFDLSQALKCDWEIVQKSLAEDVRIGKTHLIPYHKSGRGAGGNCFIKDYAAFSKLYEEIVGDKEGIDVIKSIETKNINLLVNSKKDIYLLKEVHGDIIMDHFNN